MTNVVEPGIETSWLRSAIEFAVLVAEETQKRKPPMPVPLELKAFFGKPRIPSGALGRLRRSIESDPVFRGRIAAGALPELVDDIGRLWLQQPAGWQADATALIADSTRRAAEADAAVLLRKADKRRVAAEAAAGRARAEVIRLEVLLADQHVEADRLRTDVIKAEDLLAETRAELIDVRNEVRHARDREAASAAKLAAVTAELARVAAHPVAIEPAPPAPEVVDEVIVRGLLESALSVAESAALTAQLVADGLAVLARGEPAKEPARPTGEGASAPGRRRPLALPGGVIATSAEAAAHLARSDASMLIDGYNVAMLGWPRLKLADQRSALIDSVENVVRRFGTDATIIFDGSEVIGAHSASRRSTRVVFSPAGVIADDVIRDEIDRLPSGRHVVVVTNDAELARDARAKGANVLPSNALLALL